MDVRILNLDGALTAQTGIERYHFPTIDVRDWGPRIRIGCSFGQFRLFEKALANRLGSDADYAPQVTLYGSGDFHHVTLAMLRRRTKPFNLLLMDNHPDWVRRIPFLHCGTWLSHALEMPNLQQVFHIGGEVDFDNQYRWLAPWSELRSGRIVVLPALRRFQNLGWRRVPHQPLKESGADLDLDLLTDFLSPHRLGLSRWPLYVSLDKDVLGVDDAVVNWDSGRLTLREVETLLTHFRELCGGQFGGMDILGDWSPVVVQGWFRKLLQWTEHPSMETRADEANRVNENTNKRLLAALGCLKKSRRLVA